ncbi:MAG: RHS repeat-associated core domain-containing protein [Lacunisphaera sp.]
MVAWRNLTPSNPPTIYAALSGSSSGTISEKNATWFAPPVAQAMGYDDDGNLTSDGLFTYTWNAENQLVRASSALATGLGFTRLRLDFKYDYLGRRTEKRVTNLDTSSETLARRFLYDGWNLLTEIDANTPATLLRSYAWGLDLTGDFTKAGGVGALLRMTNYSSGSPGTSYYPSYDGNGNIVSLINATNGNIAAVYEYDPFGNYLRNEAIDSAVGDAPFRFSTKYTDSETGWVYYGLRYYSPSLGRFINKDPIEEKGGLNLYAFCGNNCVNHWDYLGREVTEDPAEALGRNYAYQHGPMPLIYAVTNSLTSQYAKNLGVGSSQAIGGGGVAIGAFIAITNPEISIPAGIISIGVFTGGVLESMKGYGTVASTITQGPTSSNTAYFQNLSSNPYGLAGQILTEATGNTAYRNGGELFGSVVDLGSSAKGFFEAKGLLEQTKALYDTGSSAFDAGGELYDFMESLQGGKPAAGSPVAPRSDNKPSAQTTMPAVNAAALASISISNVDHIIYDPNTGTVTVVTKGGVQQVVPPTAAADPNNQAPIMGYNTAIRPPPPPTTEL